VIARGRASRAEIQQHWSIDDLADANDAVDADDEAQRVLAQLQEAEHPRR
jgi:hypothetical protein